MARTCLLILGTLLVREANCQQTNTRRRRHETTTTKMRRRGIRSSSSESLASSSSLSSSSSESSGRQLQQRRAKTSVMQEDLFRPLGEHNQRGDPPPVHEDDPNEFLNSADNDTNEQGAEETVPVIIGFQRAQHHFGSSPWNFLDPLLPQDDMISEQQFFEQVNELSYLVEFDGLVAGIRAATAHVPSELVDVISHLDGVAFVERDVMVYPDSVYSDGETIPPGIQHVVGNSLSNFPPARTTPKRDCDDPNVFKIGVIDGGLDAGHFDFEFCNVDENTGNRRVAGQQKHCMGGNFLPSSPRYEGQYWHNSRRGHGTHVVGTMAASGINGIGIAGMMPDEDFCLVVARVFGDNGGGSLSKVAEALTWMADIGTKVVNMSLGTSTHTTTMQNAVTYAEDRGVLLVGSAGNRNTQLKNYPAAYDEVIAVAAVDSANDKAWFSNYGDWINIAAPGVYIQSTMPRQGLQPFSRITSPGLSNIPQIDGVLATNTEYVGTAGVSGVLVDCGAGNSDCPEQYDDFICYMQSGSATSILDKALQCYDSGAVGGIISSNNRVFAAESINSVFHIGIPIVVVNSAFENFLGTLATTDSPVFIDNPLLQGYGYKSGTSMAAPHVAGAASFIWRQCTACSKEVVRNCILGSASGQSPSIYYGHGILDVASAFECVVNDSCCPDTDISDFLDATGAPSSLPSSVPSSFPSSGEPETDPPTESPSITASLSPSVAPATESLPSDSPSESPTISDSPSESPTITASLSPSVAPTFYAPSDTPSMAPSRARSVAPSKLPTNSPSLFPTPFPTPVGSDFPSDIPSDTPVDVAGAYESSAPSQFPTPMPSRKPINVPSMTPSHVPISPPPSQQPSVVPSTSWPSVVPSIHPTSPHPSVSPSFQQTKGPTVQPSQFPSEFPSETPSSAFPTPSPTTGYSSTAPSLEPTVSAPTSFIRDILGLFFPPTP